LVEEPRPMTATEVMQRAQEKGALLAPTAGRQQSELLGQIITREIDILARAGLLSAPFFDPMPPQLAKRGGNYDVLYQSPLSRAQRAEQAVGLSNTLGILTPIAQVKPDILDVYDWDTITEDLSTEINGLPETWILPPKVVAQIRAQRQQQAQTQQMIDAAPGMTSAAANITKMQQNAAAGGASLPNLTALAGATQQ